MEVVIMIMNLIIGALFTWGLGLLPAYLIRFKTYKRPLKKRYAVLIAFLVLFIHVFLATVLSEMMGVHQYNHPVLNLVAIASYYILIKKDKASENKED